MEVTTMEAETTATDGARAMLARDRVSTWLGMELVECGPGYAVVTMAVRDDMLNGFDCVHGGITFALADTTFAVACNEDDSVTLSSGAEITYLRPGRVGQVLTATATRRSAVGRSAILDVTVRDQAGEVVAEFRGHGRRTRLTRPGATG
jgi:acyl-CoA thioesterase